MMRIVIAEDQAMLRGALVALLNLEDDIEVVAQAADGEAAWQAVLTHQPDLLVSDIEMPMLTGLELAQRLHDHKTKCAPEQALATTVVIVTTFARAGYLRRALDAGVRGYLLKDAPSAQLAKALREVHSGGRVIDPQLAMAAWTEQDPLSDRERQVLRLAGEGVSSAEIAKQLNLSQGTVRNYLSESMSKLGAANRIEAYRMARQQGWL
jgi:two-component system, NarL family, response regulator DesR